MGVRVSLNVPFATKFKENHKAAKGEKIKTWSELVLKVACWPSHCGTLSEAFCRSRLRSREIFWW
jgi:hypothetical protein